MPPVVPIILVQGCEAWTVLHLADSFPAFPDRLRPFLPDFTFLLVDLARESVDHLRTHYGNRSVLVAMELMKAIFSRDEVARLMERLSPADGPPDRDLALHYLRVVLRYSFTRSDLAVQEALTLKRHPETWENSMTMEEEILLRGEKRGIEKGVEQGLRQKALEAARKMRDRGCDWAFVTDITGIKPEELG